MSSLLFSSLDFGISLYFFRLSAFVAQKKNWYIHIRLRVCSLQLQTKQNYYSLKLIVMSLFNTGKNKKDKKKNAPAGNKSMFIAPKGGGKANTKTSNNAGKHVGGAQRGA